MKSAYSQSTQSVTHYSLKINKTPMRSTDFTQKPITSRSIKSAQPKRFHTHPILTKPITQNNLPISLAQNICDRYTQQSYLSQNHETVLKSIEFMSQDVKNHLNTNHYEVLNQEQSYLPDPAILFKMYDTLFKLDKDIMQELFLRKEVKLEDQIGQSLKKEITPVDNFRFDFFTKAINIMDDLLASIIHRIEDKSVSLFIEQLWKFWVVILDINTQWSQNRYKMLLEIQVGQMKKKYDELQQAYDRLREKYIQKQQGNKLMLIMEQKRVQNLKDENLKLLQQIVDLETRIEDLNNIENAQGDLQKITMKMKEIDVNYSIISQNIISNHKQATISVKNIGEILTQTTQHWKPIISFNNLEELDQKCLKDLILQNINQSKQWNCIWIQSKPS